MSAVFHVTIAVWVLGEFTQRVREHRRGTAATAHDRHTRTLIALCLAVAAVGAALAVGRAPGLDIGGPHRLLGVVVMWAGLALRGWAVQSLGRSFRTTVAVDADQPVIRSGPYRRLRHPSYTGLLLISAGLGLALGNWLSLLLCVALPLLGIVRRITVEEAELDRVLGEPYRAYQRDTSRLLPGVW